jgi:predicted RNA-binding Zn-ribbon protein involved in translation (DUF1610 family)
MRKLFLDNLPKRGKRINWINSVGYKVNFEYDNIIGEFLIIDYNRNNEILKINYLGKEYFINSTNFLHLKLSVILGLIRENHSYIHKIDEIINTNTSKIHILEQIRIKVKRKNMDKRGDKDKGYKYKCLNCGNIDIISESRIKNGCGCNVCSSPSRHKILIGYNDLWTTHPEIARLLEDPNDGYTHTHSSHKAVSFICPNCKLVNKNKYIRNIIKRGLSCSQCSDGISYPNKFIRNFLHQLNLDVKPEYSPNWMEGKRIDFYFKLNGKEYGLEADGSFHKIDNKMSGQSASESKRIDDYKDILMKNNNVKVIRINCEYSNLEFIKNNILHSKLIKIIDISQIDWLKCHEFACNSLVKVVCDLWNDGFKSTKEIAEKIKLHSSTVLRYLKKGSILGWCDYDPKEAKRKSFNYNLRKKNILMADFTLCQNKNCPSKKDCYRYQCTPNPIYQSYSLFVYNEEAGKCEDFVQYW